MILTAVEALAWALVATASSVRPRLSLEGYFAPTCWSLAAIDTVCVLGAVASGASWPVVLAAPICSTVLILLRALLWQSAYRRAAPEGVAALGLLAVAVVGAASVMAGLWLTHTVTRWPDRLSIAAHLCLVVVAALALLVQFPGLRHVTDWLMEAVASVSVVLAVGLVGLSVVHLVAGDFEARRVRAGEAVAAIALAGLVALIVTPRVVRSARRRLRHDRPAVEQALSHVDEMLQRRLPLGELLLQSAELLRRSLRLESAEVWTVSGDVIELQASDPFRARRTLPIGESARRVANLAATDAPGDWAQTWIPGLVEGGRDSCRVSVVSYGGELQGLLVIDGERVTGEVAREMAEQLAHRLGPVMHSRRLDESLSDTVLELEARERELRASRERLVAAADSERERIERDLHDGAQQHLVALGVNLQLALGLVTSDPGRAVEILDQLVVLARSATEELRALSHGIYPQALQDAGIGPALDAASRRHEGVRVRVISSGLGRYSRDVEAAVYFACNEAIANAVKHADAQQVVVNLVADPEQLVFEVIDDGRGFSASTTSGTRGLANMVDRIGAIDGTLSIESGDDGTRVLGAVPLRTPDGTSGGSLLAQVDEDRGDPTVQA